MDLTTRRTTSSADMFDGTEMNDVASTNHKNPNKARSTKSIFSIRSIMDVEDDQNTESTNNNSVGECFFSSSSTDILVGKRHYRVDFRWRGCVMENYQISVNAHFPSLTSSILNHIPRMTWLESSCRRGQRKDKQFLTRLILVEKICQLSENELYYAAELFAIDVPSPDEISPAHVPFRFRNVLNISARCDRSKFIFSTSIRGTWGTKSKGTSNSHFPSSGDIRSNFSPQKKEKYSSPII